MEPDTARPSLFILFRPEGCRDPDRRRAEAVPSPDLILLARALATSPLWGRSEATLIVRSGPDPVLAVIGRFDETVRARLEALCWQLGRRGDSVRHVGYAEAEDDCTRLAERLRDSFGLEELQRFRYIAIPRGGFFVLGMLAYLLDLPPSAFANPVSSEDPLVVVDDCALSGSRFRSFVQPYRDRPVIFAHLYSHPDLRTAIGAAEDRLLACVSAQDLHDDAPELFGGDYVSWREQWRARSPRSYWVGVTEHLCFAWGEPDFATWNPVGGQVEAGWRLVPGEVCLKNRALARRDPVPVEVQTPAKGPLAPPDHVLFGRLGGRLVVGNANSGEAVALDDVAADMWDMILAEGDEAAAGAALARTYDVSFPTLRSDLERFVAEAAARGLLARQPSGLSA